MGKSTLSTEPVMGLLSEQFPPLSSSAENFLRQHPRDARMAVAVALEAAALQCEARANEALEKMIEGLRPLIVHRPEDQEMLGVSAAAVRLEVSRPTIYDWVAKKMLLAWKSTKRGLTIPAAQILAPGKVVPGIDKILEIIEDPELAWAFLSQEWPFSGEAVAPLKKLTAGQVEEVLAAAPSFGMTYT